MLERLHFPHLNNHPWNQKAKQLLLQLPDDDVETEYGSILPYNQVDEDRLYVLQLIEWGLNTCPSRPSWELPSDASEWTESEGITFLNHGL